MKCRYDSCKTCNKECKHYTKIGGIILCDYLKDLINKINLNGGF